MLVSFTPPQVQAVCGGVFGAIFPVTMQKPATGHLKSGTRTNLINQETPCQKAKNEATAKPKSLKP